MGVCRIAEIEGRPICFWDLISADCMLHHLSKELFPLVFSALGTWKTFKALMALRGVAGLWFALRTCRGG